MKILIIRPFPEKLNIRSYNVQEIGLAKALIRKGHEVGIVFFEPDGINHDETIAVDDSYVTIYWRTGKAVLKNGLFADIGYLIEPYDVIQVHEYDQLYSYKLYSSSKKPVVIYHGPYYDKFNKGYNLRTALFDRFVLNRKKCKDVVVLTKSILAEDFLRKKGFENVTTVGVGLDDDRISIEAPTDRVNDIIERISCDNVFLYVGKIEERRNIFFLLDVFAAVCEFSECQLVIVGDGEPDYLTSVKKKVDELHLSERIIMTGKLTQSELPHLYRKTDYFLFPSSYDIFGMVLLEAMYYGQIVISSENGGSKTLICNNMNGIVIKDFSVDEWKRCILHALEDIDRKQISKNAENTIKENYLWSNLANDFLCAYELAIEKYKENHDE